MTDDNDLPPDIEHDIEMEQEEFLGHALAGNPADRIATLNQRIEYLRGQLADYLNHLDTATRKHHIEALNDCVAYTKTQIAEARRQLAEFKTQQANRN